MIHKENFEKYIKPHFNIETFLHNKKNIIFDEKKHKYMLKDCPYLKFKSVSSELSHCSNYYQRHGQLAPSKEILERAALKGKIIHRALELKLSNKYDESKLYMYKDIINIWINEISQHFKKNPHLKIIMLEEPLISRKEGLAGTADLILWNNKKKCVEIWDWKSGKYASNIITKWKYSGQLWGYIMLLKENWKPISKYQKIKTFVIHVKGSFMIKEELNNEQIWK